MRINEDFKDITSDFSEETWHQIHTRAFKRMFGDWENTSKESSVVVDDDGYPKILFHSFDEVNYDSGMIFLTSNRDFSEEFGETTEEFFVNLRHPYVTSDGVLRDSDGNEIIFQGEPATIGYLDCMDDDYIQWLTDNYDGIFDDGFEFLVVFDKKNLIRVKNS